MLFLWAGAESPISYFLFYTAGAAYSHCWCQWLRQNHADTALLGVWPPDKGGIYWQGKSIWLWMWKIFEKISVPCLRAVYFLLNPFGKNFRILCPDIEESDMWQALQDAQLDTVVKSMAQGLDTPLGQDACDLSGDSGVVCLQPLP